jgi:hypothetical protein
MGETFTRRRQHAETRRRCQGSGVRHFGVTDVLTLVRCLAALLNWFFPGRFSGRLGDRHQATVDHVMVPIGIDLAVARFVTHDFPFG